MTDNWATPQPLFDKLHAEFQFSLDVCASTENAKCAFFFTQTQDGLAQDWTRYGPVVWMNPPYAKPIAQWMRKAYETARAGTTVVCLVPTRTNPPWWHDWVMRAHEIRFIVKKISFGRPPGSLVKRLNEGVPFTGHAIVVFRAGPEIESPVVSSYTWR